MASEEKRCFNFRCRVILKEKTQQLSNAEELPKKKTPRKTKAQIQRDYRERLKKDPNRYREERYMDSLRSSIWRASLTDEQRAEQRQKTRLRVAKHRAEKKAKGIAEIRKTPKTRSTIDKQKEYWRLKKREQRAKITPQQHRRKKEQRRAKYAANKAEENEAIRLVKMPYGATPKIKRTVKGRRIISPNQNYKQLEFLQETTEAIKLTMSRLNKKRNLADLNKKRILITASVMKKKRVRQHMKYLGFGYRSLKKAFTMQSLNAMAIRKKRSDSLHIETVKQVENFFNRGDISRSLPDARSAKTIGNVVVGRKVMERTLRSAYTQFNTENPEHKISFSAFKKLRPKHILTMDNNKREACLCEYCINIDFKIKSLSAFACFHQLGQCTIKDRYEASNHTLCPKNGLERKKACLDRQCPKCGLHQLDEFLQPLVAKHGHSEITWMRWEMQFVSYGENQVKRMVKVKKSGTVQDIIAQLKIELEPFSQHLFNAFWQWKRYDDICQNLPENWVVFCSDFAENYTCQAQDEAQGAHWSNVQCTIHPIVASYRCQEPECDSIITDSIMFISDDIKHCYHGVQHFTSLAVKHLTETGVIIKKLIHFSDGAGQHYKCKVNFTDCSFSKADFGFDSERHYFGSRHGKGPCDREIGVLKKQVKSDVKARQVEVANAHDLYEYGKRRLTRPQEPSHVHARREFIFVKCGEINRDRPGRTHVKPMKNTMKSHCVRGVQPYAVISRERSCFCKACITSEGLCHEAEITGSWVKAYLGTAKRPPVFTTDREVQGIGGDVAVHTDEVETESGEREVQGIGGDVAVETESGEREVQGIGGDVAVHTDEVETESGESDDVSDTICINDFVAVKVAGKKQYQIFVAKVESVHDDTYGLSYMEETGKELFTWPIGKPITYAHPHSDIITKFEAPVPVYKGTRIYLKFKKDKALSLFAL